MAIDRNSFNFIEHEWRNGHRNKDGNITVSEDLKTEFERKHKCKTLTMTRGDGVAVQVNSGAADDIATWQKQGFELQEEKRATKKV